MKLSDPKIQAKVRDAAREAGQTYVRVFGGTLRSLDKARDLDLVVDGRKELSFEAYSGFCSELGSFFGKSVDLVRGNCWDYIETIEPLCAIADKEPSRQLLPSQ